MLGIGLKASVSDSLTTLVSLVAKRATVVHREVVTSVCINMTITINRVSLCGWQDGVVVRIELLNLRVAGSNYGHSHAANRGELP